jgi:hypothetical protein
MKPLLFSYVVIINCFFVGVKCSVLEAIEANRDLLLLIGINKVDDSFLDIVTGVFSQDLWNDQEGVSESLYTHLSLAWDRVFELLQMHIGSYLK